MDPIIFTKLLQVLPEFVAILKKYTELMEKRIEQIKSTVQRQSRATPARITRGAGASWFSQARSVVHSLRGANMQWALNLRKRFGPRTRKAARWLAGTKLGRVGVAAFRGGSAAAAGMGLTGAAGSIAGGVTGVIAAAAAAIYGLGKAAKAASWAMLESQRRLAENSPHMAQVFAQYDVKSIMRDLRRGRDQAATAKLLADTRAELSDTMQPLESLFANLKNLAFAGFNKIGSVLLKPFEWLASKINPLLERIAHNTGGGSDESMTFSRWILQMIGERENAAAMAQPPPAENFPGGNLFGGRPTGELRDEFKPAAPWIRGGLGMFGPVGNALGIAIH